MSNNNSVDLRKQPQQSWRDPATGEIYPAGDPSYVPESIPRSAPQVISSPNQLPAQNQTQGGREPLREGMKYCVYCGGLIDEKAVLCVKCGRQVEALKTSPAPQPVVVNNIYNAQPMGEAKDKWVAFVLCFFLGVFGAHRFYEGRTGTAVLWLCTAGLFGIGWLADIISILCKPNPYYIYR